MSTANSTPTVGLSQYTRDDKVAYLSNYNEDMLKIDTSINSVLVGMIYSARLSRDINWTTPDFQ